MAKSESGTSTCPESLHSTTLDARGCRQGPPTGEGVTRRCLDTNFYAAGHKIDSGSAWVRDRDGVRRRVVSGHSRVGDGVHVLGLSPGTRLWLGDGTTALFDPAYSRGRRGRSGPMTLGGPAARRVGENSRTVTRLLRHVTLTGMDAAGWVAVDTLAAACGLSAPEIIECVLADTKGRLETYDSYIRACQGHRAGGLVRAAALEASWEEVTSPGTLYHGTRTTNVAGIVAEGLLAGVRTHVHLAASRAALAGTRGRDEATIEVDAQVLARHGEKLWRAGNGVILARRVGPTALRPAP